jgi:type III restriction enzyme
LNIKPVVLFKAKTIAESKAFEQEFYKMIQNLSGDDIKRVIDTVSANLPNVRRMVNYFAAKDVDYTEFASELREDFSVEHCISVNDDKEASERQILLNSLENADNPYRAIFEVKKLDEGWDVLNLFDIVRLYETRDAKNGKPGAATIAEAQLIGRGARYCPFAVDEDDERYQRKYDSDIENPLRVCEELYYHCQYDSRYIAELNKALIAAGIMADNVTEVKYVLKDEFKRHDLYQNGIVFANDRHPVSYDDITAMLPSIHTAEYNVSIDTGKVTEDIVMQESITNTSVKTSTYRTTIGDIAKYSYSIVHAATRRNDIYKFAFLKQKFPNLKSIKELITSLDYLGGVKIVIESREATPSASTLFVACLQVLTKIGNEISAIKTNYEGTEVFRAKAIREVFRGKTLHLTDTNDTRGVSQNAAGVPEKWRLDLSTVDWFVFTDNFGTSEEKAFVKYFSTFVDQLRAEYDMVYLVRNERQLVLYSFDGGERFEPDFLLFLRKCKTDGFEQYQLFIEPKGGQLIATDKWKEDFLLQIQARGLPTKTFKDDGEYKVWGLPFYNSSDNARLAQITAAFADLV